MGLLRLYIRIIILTSHISEEEVNASLQAGASAYVVIAFLGIESVAMQKGILFAMSVPQLVTGFTGILCAKKMVGVLKKR